MKRGKRAMAAPNKPTRPPAKKAARSGAKKATRTPAASSQAQVVAAAPALADVRARIDTIFRGPGSAARSQLRDAVLVYRIENAR